LLQSRNAVDPMVPQEIRCFARALACDAAAIEVIDLLTSTPSLDQIRQADMLLLGGSGHYSAASEPAARHPPRPRREWLARALDCLREIHHLSKPTFASCWGFQAMSRALGGECVNDPASAELGTIDVALTAEGRTDPVFSSLPPTFAAQAGHEDRVIAIPPDAVLLASSARVREQAFCFAGKPIYCTQFHPELDRTGMLERVAAYPEYVERIAQIPYDDFVFRVHETPEANSLLRKLVMHIFSQPR
jgi:GMP synthase (glutamine-hydrolysing)